LFYGTAVVYVTAEVDQFAPDISSIRQVVGDILLITFTLD